MRRTSREDDASEGMRGKFEESRRARAIPDIVLSEQIHRYVESTLVKHTSLSTTNLG